ncbi:tRNA (adenosine(37)-N6)-threonylcarbamoyltransferase complex dimerization subunit type 1 TsaB [Qipengyuania qiaonensis]|uniref:tRNA (Adenosine(37)-N6)-threonylcarbamoyltransferase complex dimerization subunit type 1 TsaB n=1 Tax=Qipengyuania qiaonensis TaxID=2867240 RepID=A0ABS7J9N9_9SPHN|nr:tRNA (adenosine(37)-N6)-threonylcarbamoyltransferase complex dimerization subunit type 1 TsaB [Qipengyuania qiaonensis]MBX7482579.1 tRNA (adenosine(37)-N6)-threonylcarbamoyltransferase complex dimerization subunit type 1 TsaB [Qipengyuania qiaonensis]
MRILAIETATEACSVALFDDGGLRDARHEVLGRGHAERLVPMIAELPDKGRADEIRVSLGPGSFTGVRIGLAVARALGIAWHGRVLGYPTLALVAAMAGRTSKQAITVCMTGGHGEWFLQDFGPDGMPASALTTLPPDLAAKRGSREILVGSRAEELGTMTHTIPADIRLPDARYVPDVPDELLTGRLAPLYGRPPDAKLPGQ